MMRFGLPRIHLLPLVALLALTGCAQPERAPDDAKTGEEIAPAADADPLSRLHLRASTGAAAGYVEDAGCAICHRAKFDSYQGVGMAQSLRWRNDELMFERWQLDARGERINAIEQRVDWILGSGHRARVYLYRTRSGELYQLPIAWYSQERAWGMAPGYDRADHDGITRRIRRECLF